MMRAVSHPERRGGGVGVAGGAAGRVLVVLVTRTVRVAGRRPAVLRRRRVGGVGGAVRLGVLRVAMVFGMFGFMLSLSYQKIAVS